MAPVIRAIADPPGGYGQDGEVMANADGTFAMTELRPGAYKIFAVLPSARGLDFTDPEVQARYAQYGERVVLESGGSQRVDLETVR
ncbi:MAG: hypothetical protein R2748_13910 [Bryobacterales bacterium]